MIGRASMTAVRYLMNSADPAAFIDWSGEEHEQILRLVTARDAAGAAAADGAAYPQRRAELFRVINIFIK